MVTFCPKCGTKLGADESFIGRQVQCGKCSHRFTVMPAAAEPTAPPPAPEKFPEAPPPPPSPHPETPTSPPPAPTTGEAKPSPADAYKPQPKSSKPPSIKKAAADADAAGGEKCPKCGATIPAGGVLCVQCGTFFKQPQQPEKKKSGSMGVLIGIAAACVIGAAGWYGWQWWSQRQASGETTEAPPQPPPPQPPGPATPPPPTPSKPEPSPAPDTATPAKPLPPLPRADLPALVPEEIDAMAKLPAEEPAPAPDTSNPSRRLNPLVPQRTLLQTVDLKGPKLDRYKADKPPEISAATRLVTLRFDWRQADLDKAVAISPQTVKVNTDIGPGLFYGIELSGLIPYTGWLPRGATGDSSSILETIQLATRDLNDFSTELLAEGKCLVPSTYTNWFRGVVNHVPAARVLVCSAYNQFHNINTSRPDPETGAFFVRDRTVLVHLLLPAPAATVRVQLGDHPPFFVPVQALASIPTTSQPDPRPFIQAAMEKALQHLNGSAPEEIIAGAHLLIEAGNLDMQKRLKPDAFKTWADSVRQLLAHADVDCRAAAADVILRSPHVDAKLRVELLGQAVKNDAVAVRRRAAELLREKPGLIADSYQGAMEQLQALMNDADASVRAAAHVSNLRLGLAGDAAGFDFHFEPLQKGLKDAAPSVRLAILEATPVSQDELGTNAVARLDKVLAAARLNLFDTHEPARHAAARAILGGRSPAAVRMTGEALQQIPDKVGDLFARASLDVPIGTIDELEKRSPALAHHQVQSSLVPFLQKLLDDTDQRVRHGATRVLGAFESDAGNDSLAIAVRHADLGVRLTAISALAAPARQVLPPATLFADGLNDADARVRSVTFTLLDQVLHDAGTTVGVASNVAGGVAVPAARLAVVQKIAPVAQTNAPVLMAMRHFLADADENVWRAALTPFTRTTLQFPWTEVEPLWKLLLDQSTVSRRLGAFWIVRLAEPARPESVSPEGRALDAIPPDGALAEAAHLLLDPEPQIREAALVYVIPHRTGAHVGEIEKILTHATDLSAGVRNQVLVALAKPSTSWDLEVVDRIRPATEDDKKREREALAAAARGQAAPAPTLPAAPMMPPGGPMPPGMPGAPAPAPRPAQPQASPAKSGNRVAFMPINYRVMVPVISSSDITLLARWATSQNPSANAAANYLLQLVRSHLSRSWLLPSERATLVQSLQKLAEMPAVAAGAKTLLGQVESRYPIGQAAKTLTADQTQGAADNTESLVKFLSPRKREMVIATYKHSGGAMIDIWYRADETIPEVYPPDAKTVPNAGDPWNFASKLDGSRVDPIDREMLARLEWASANVPKEKLHEALTTLAQAEGELGPSSRRMALEGFALLAMRGDTDAEAQAIKLGWRKS